MTKAELNQNLQRLIGLPLVKSVRHFPEIESTNDFAMEMIGYEESEAVGALIIADEQAKGRGRMGKSWYSPIGGIYFSLVFNQVYPSWFSLISASAVSRAITMHICDGTMIKWPNDILFEDKKCAGILIQTAKGMTILGTGINTFDNQLNPLETSFALGPMSISKRFDLIERIILNIDDLLKSIYLNGIDYHKAKILEKMAFLDQEIKIINGNDEYSGIFKDISSDGAIIIENNGQRQKFISGSLIPKDYNSEIENEQLD